MLLSDELRNTRSNFRPNNINIHGVPELAYQPLTVYFNICSKRDFATINIQTLVVFKLKPF
jgi:hypothetical protein